MAVHERFLERSGRWFHDHWHDVSWEMLVIALPFSMFLIGDELLRFVPDRYDGNVAVAGAASAVLIGFSLPVLAVVRLRKAKSMSNLERENKLLSEATENLVRDVRNTAGGYLLDLSELLGFGQQKPCVERATIYIHDSESGFRAVRRHSSDPELSREGRAAYPIDEGCIGKAWSEGHHCHHDGPCPDSDDDAYMNWHKTLGINKGVAKKFKMRSRFYFAWRVLDRGKATPLAVIVIESTEPGRFTESELLEVFRNQQGRYLSDLISMMKPQLPDSAVAREREM